MIVKQLLDYESFTYTYLLFNHYQGKAMIIDPVLGRVEQYLKLLDEYGLILEYCFDTHVHADHITAAGKLREITNCITLLGEQTEAKCVSKMVKEHEEFFLEDTKFTTIYTPGHTQDSYCLYTKGMVFTGDTLLIRSAGRTDFQAGNPHQQYDSIVNKLFKLPDDTIVYPAHDYNGNMSSTIWEEKKFNPRISGKTIDEFVHIMHNLKLANPKLMDIAVPANLNCGNNI